jgi:hypothetical protein
MNIVFDHSLGNVWSRTGGKGNGISDVLRDARWMSPAHQLRAERMRQVRMLLEKRDREYFLDEGRSAHTFPPIKSGGQPYYRPLNLMSLAVQKMADLLFGEPPTITTDDDALQKVIDEILDRSWIHATMQGAALDCCAAGDTYLEVTRVNGRSLIGHVPAAEIFPLGVQGPDQQYPGYVRYSTETLGGDAGTAVRRYLLKTIYSAGVITRECYQVSDNGKAGQSLGQRVELDKWPARRDGKALPDVERTGLSKCNLIYVPNGFGAVSDFDGLIEMQDDLTAAHSQIKRILAKHGDPKMYADESAGDENGNLPIAAEVYWKKQGEDPPGYIPFPAELTASMEDRKFSLLAFCVQCEMPPSLLGIKDDAVAETAAKMRLNASTALAKAARKATYWTAALRMAIGLAVEIETLGPPRSAIGVMLQDGLPTDMTELAEQIATFRNAGVISIERALRLMMLSRGELKDELAALKAEAAAATPSVLMDEQTQPGDDADGERASDLPATSANADAGVAATNTLNGAQITAAISVIGQLQTGAIGKTTAVELLVAVGIERATAQSMVNESGSRDGAGNQPLAA